MELRAQTKMLCGSLPGLAKWFIEYDAQGHDWVLVRWKNRDPAKVVFADLEIPPTLPDGEAEVRNRFSSRTAALRRSAELCQENIGRTEEGHMGVWRWDSGSDTHYQSVFPAEAWRRLSGPTAPDARSERAHTTKTVPVSAGLAQLWKIDPADVTPSHLAQLNDRELEAIRKAFNRQDSGLRELITAELTRRYPVEENNNPSADNSFESEPAIIANAAAPSEIQQTVPAVEVPVEAAKTETQKAAMNRLPVTESPPKKRAWWQFWLPKP